MFSGNPADIPPDLKLIALLLNAADIQDWEPQTLPQLYEFLYRYSIETLTTAQVYADHAGLPEISADCIKLAIETRIGSSFVTTPSPEILAEIATKKNRVPLPLVGEKFGIRLPPEKHCLTKESFQINPVLILADYRS